MPSTKCLDYLWRWTASQASTYGWACSAFAPHQPHASPSSTPCSQLTPPSTSKEDRLTCRAQQFSSCSRVGLLSCLLLVSSTWTGGWRMFTVKVNGMVLKSSSLSLHLQSLATLSPVSLTWQTNWWSKSHAKKLPALTSQTRGTSPTWPQP